jgi:PAS domain S-box-containing protein
VAFAHEALNRAEPMATQQSTKSELLTEVETLRKRVAALEARPTTDAADEPYKTLFESAPVGIATVDQNSIVLTSNPMFQTMLGVSAEDLNGRSIRDFTDPDSSNRGTGDFGRMVLGEADSVDQERRIKPVRGTAEWVRCRYSAVRGEEGRFLFAIRVSVDITERKQLEAELREREQLLQHLYRRLSESKEEQSRFIARELHDEIGQQLTGLKMQLEIGTDAAKDRALSIIRDLMKRVSELSLDLRPAVLDDLGLAPALRSQFERYTCLTGVEVHFDDPGLTERFDPRVEVAAFRIIQEALTNVARHAHVGDASVDVSVEAGVLHLRVEDRGRGMTLRSRRDLGGAWSVGISGMRERALALGGSLDVTSKPGRGTTVLADLPLRPG